MASVASDRVLVTGAAGFVGSNLVRELAGRGTFTYAVVRPGSDTWRIDDLRQHLTLVEIDLSDPQAIRSMVDELEPTSIFNLARQSPSAGPWSRFEVNVAAVFYLLEAATRSGVRRFIHTASSLEYGDAPSPYQDDGPLRPTTEYGAMKAAASLLVEERGRQGLSTLTLRLFHVYGPGEQWTRLVPRAIVAALDGAELPLTEPGFEHDFVYVGDVVRALVAAERRQLTGTALNVCTGHSTGNHHVVDLVEEVTGRPIRRREGGFSPRPWDRTGWSGDLTRTRALLDWDPRYDLRAGLKETVAWIEGVR